MMVEIDEEYIKFGNAIKWVTVVGLILMLTSTGMYLLDIDPFVEPDRVVKTWHLPASEFWKTNIGKEVKGYSEFLYILHPDNIAIFSLVILSLSPIIGIAIIFPKLRGVYRVLALVIIFELVFAALRPMFLLVGGE